MTGTKPFDCSVVVRVDLMISRTNVDGDKLAVILGPERGAHIPIEQFGTSGSEFFWCVRGRSGGRHGGLQVVFTLSSVYRPLVELVTGNA
jgi:hypothetical protein